MEKRIPIREGLWRINDRGEEYLIGSRCTSCREIFFPNKTGDFASCTHCQSTDLEEVPLSNQGKITSFTVVYQKPTGGFYRGVVPYSYGFVILPEGIKLQTLFTGYDLEKIETGMDASLVIEELFENTDGDSVCTYKFKPIRS